MTADEAGGGRPPLLRHKHHDRPSVFAPDALLREARRQKGIPPGAVPEVCILDPDGDIVRHLVAGGCARKHPAWACYHTDLYAFSRDGAEYGLLGCAVGASFAVLVAEELFASGCRLLLSVTSAGQILPLRPPPYFIVIDRALRDEGTSYHYQPAADYSHAAAELVALAADALAAGGNVLVGPTWTTDAPFRETAAAIAAARAAGILAVEMEAAARRQAVLCLAHVTNQMGQTEGDFEKGVAAGAEASLAAVAAVAGAWRGRNPGRG